MRMLDLPAFAGATSLVLNILNMKNPSILFLALALSMNIVIDHIQTGRINAQQEVIHLVAEHQLLVREFCSLSEISCKYDKKNTSPKRETQKTEPTIAADKHNKEGRGAPSNERGVALRGIVQIGMPADVYVTAYSRESSCHNPEGDKCLMASGKDVYEGAIACPRHWPLGTKVYLPGLDQIFTCEDRYSLYLDEQRGLPTVDVFMNNHLDAVTFGKQRMTAKVL